MSEPMFEVPEQEVVETTGRRGRPRAQETLARDEAVVQALASGITKTREQLADELATPPNLVYLALWRLKRDGRVERISDGNVRHAWRLVN